MEYRKGVSRISLGLPILTLLLGLVAPWCLSFRLSHHGRRAGKRERRLPLYSRLQLFPNLSL
jgi:hypothetical protein